MVYVQITDGYVTDCLEFKYEDYVEVEAENPPDIMNGCYQLVKDKFVRDEVKYKKFIEEQENPPIPPVPPEPLPIEAQIAELQEAIRILTGGADDELDW